MRPYAVFDIDGTLIRWQLYHALADALAKRNLIDIKSYNAVKRARLSWKKRAGEDSFTDYENQLIQVFDRSLQGIGVEDFDEAVDTVIREYKDQVYTYTRDLLIDLKQQNYLLFAISGSPEALVTKLAEYYGFDDSAASNYEIIGGKFSGKKRLSLGRKEQLLGELIQKHGAVQTNSIGVGDSEGDIAMLGQVEKPIAFNPSKGLQEHAIKHKWPIVIERKNVIYKLSATQNVYQLEK